MDEDPFWADEDFFDPLPEDGDVYTVWEWLGVTGTIYPDGSFSYWVPAPQQETSAARQERRWREVRRWAAMHWYDPNNREGLKWFADRLEEFHADMVDPPETAPKLKGPVRQRGRPGHQQCPRAEQESAAGESPS